MFENELSGVSSSPVVEENVSVSRPKKKCGFAVMDKEKVRELAGRGGRAAHSQGVAHQFNSDEARIAGALGGRAPHKTRGRRKVAEPTE